jgi:hypothetical protein
VVSLYPLVVSLYRFVVSLSNHGAVRQRLDSSSSISLTGRVRRGLREEEGAKAQHEPEEGSPRTGGRLTTNRRGLTTNRVGRRAAAELASN